MEMISIYTAGDVADFAGKLVAYNPGGASYYFDVPDKYSTGDGGLCYGIVSRTTTPYSQSGCPLGGPTGKEEGYDLKAIIRSDGSVRTRAFVDSKIAEAPGLQMREATLEETVQIRKAILDGKAKFTYASMGNDPAYRQAFGIPDRGYER
jgi:hypothetical protein